MKLLDKILCKRLERIREELNLYIADRLERKLERQHYEETVSAQSAMVYQENIGGTIDKFLQPMPLKEDVSGFEFEEEYEVSETASDEENDDVNESVFESEEYWKVHLENNKKIRADKRDKKILSSPQISPMFSSIPKSQKSVIDPKEIHIPDFFRADSCKKSIDAILEKKAETFSTMLLRLIDEKGLKDSVVYKNANIDRRLFSKIRGDEEYVPSKKTAISFCLALQLEMEEAKKLLETAGYALSTASRFDLIIMYLIENKEYNIHFANIVLEDYGEGTLSK